jgi:predicted transcriptional regulator
MSDETAKLLEQLAKGNPADIEKLQQLSEQLAELERAGVIRRTYDYALDQPLGRLTNVTRPATLANTTLK